MSVPKSCLRLLAGDDRYDDSGRAVPTGFRSVAERCNDCRWSHRPARFLRIHSLHVTRAP